MPKLSDAYANYYSKPDVRHALDLLDTIKNYDFADFQSEVETLNTLTESQPDVEFEALSGPVTQQSKGNELFFLSTFRTNGSSTGSAGRVYPIGPNADFWRRKIEEVARDEKASNLQSAAKPSPEEWKEAYETGGPISLLGTPDQHLRLSTDDQFLENRKYFKSLVSTNWEPAFKSVGVPVNDQMVDWQTGLNFYTCSAGRKHVLPIWAEKNGRSVNLLNMTFSPVPKSDRFDVRGFSPCECGGTQCDVDFLPHVEHAIRDRDGTVFYDPGLFQKMAGRLQNLQFFQDQATGKVSVLYSGQLDVEFLHELLKGFDHEFIPDTVLVVGREKTPSFWADDRRNVRLVKLRLF